VPIGRPSRRRSADGAVRRGEVYDAQLEPTEGSEQGGRRPVIVVGRDAINAASSVVIAVPCTTLRPGRRVYPSQVVLRVPEGGPDADSVAHRVRRPFVAPLSDSLLRHLPAEREEAARAGDAPLFVLRHRRPIGAFWLPYRDGGRARAALPHPQGHDPPQSASRETWGKRSKSRSKEAMAGTFIRSIWATRRASVKSTPATELRQRSSARR
jgi:mRNA-degrading endonuclease toxin of MazEF toxin-antitoxin module